MFSRVSSALYCSALAFVLAASPLAKAAQASPPRKQNSGPVSGPSTNSALSSAKRPVAGPFRGKLAAVDKVAKTITIGKRTFYVTPETKLKKNGQPAALEDGVIGELCSGYQKPSEDGKLIATTVNFGPKPEPSQKAPRASPKPKPNAQ